MTAAAFPRPAPAIRPAGIDDLAAITAIYAHHVQRGVASFEEIPPDAAELRRRMEAVQARGLPYLVAELDGGIRGYAYAAPYRDRSAYRYAVEDSIYVAQDWARRGLGAALLDALIVKCTELGRRQMIAVIGDSANTPSVALHSRLGFHMVGTLPSVGYKHGRWVDSVIMARALGDGDRTPPRD